MLRIALLITLAALAAVLVLGNPDREDFARFYADRTTADVAQELGKDGLVLMNSLANRSEVVLGQLGDHRGDQRPPPGPPPGWQFRPQPPNNARGVPPSYQPPPGMPEIQLLESGRNRLTLLYLPRNGNTPSWMSKYSSIDDD